MVLVYTCTAPGCRLDRHDCYHHDHHLLASVGMIAINKKMCDECDVFDVVHKHIIYGITELIPRWRQEFVCLTTWNQTFVSGQKCFLW
jgi:hypothetical protein